MPQGKRQLLRSLDFSRALLVAHYIASGCVGKGQAVVKIHDFSPPEGLPPVPLLPAAGRLRRPLIATIKSAQHTVLTDWICWHHQIACKAGRMEEKMKSYETFREVMRGMLAEKAEREGCRMMETKVYKVNQELDAVSVARAAEQQYCRTTVYYQDMYRDYADKMKDSGMDDDAFQMVSILKTAWNLLTTHPAFEGGLRERIEAKNFAGRVIWELINPAKNEKLLKTVPHRQFLDLAIIYRIKLNDMMDTIVTHALAEQMGTDEESLYKEAKRNRRKLLPAVAMMTPVPIEEQIAFLTTEYQMYGAALMLETEEIKSIANRMESDLYICPSSIHELVIIPAKQHMKENLESVIWAANQTVTKPEVFLSDTLYYYDRDKNEVRIA